VSVRYTRYADIDADESKTISVEEFVAYYQRATGSGVSGGGLSRSGEGVLPREEEEEEEEVAPAAASEAGAFYCLLKSMCLICP
jgi:hypothetical protein